MPSSAQASYTDGYTRYVPIEWGEIDPAAYAKGGEFTVNGTAADVDVTATVEVHRGEVKIDLGSDTGKVHGGASGVLYGLYDDGMLTANLIEGMNVRSVATKAQDGSQHPGSDALEICRRSLTPPAGTCTCESQTGTAASLTNGRATRLRRSSPTIAPFSTRSSR
ncbi:Ig-like domain-containing protein [Paramicrobacterium sp. CJ85]|uniref:Ig-like domain-containing protein n=1 Tax=Paramicrobacterium sp. CJ85 TaxID=3445355 RepID=UPI003F6248DD